MNKTSRAARGASSSPPPSRVTKSAAASALIQTRSRRDAETNVGGGSEVSFVGGRATGKSEVWQARIGAELAEQLRADAEVLGLDGRTDIVKAALELLHRRAAEQRMAQSVEGFYDNSTPPLPLGVTPSDADS